MPRERDPADESPATAEEVFAVFLERVDGNESVSFEAFCREYPGLEKELRSLKAFHDGVDRAHCVPTRTSSGSETARADVDALKLKLRSLEPEPGDIIDAYRLLSLLGEGGFGRVFLAEQLEPVKRRVALKVLKAGLDTAEVVARFDAERQALALMNHPNISRILDAGTTPAGVPYFVMEHTPGISITEYCDRHRLGTRRRLELFVQVCDAVQHAHQKAVIHRDIKPSNVLVQVEGERAVPKVIDFGVAKAMNRRLTEKTLFTEIGQLIGTPAYMSPEQAEMSPLEIDTRTDVYSLGILLYELLVGALPFDSGVFARAGFAQLHEIIRQEEPPRPSSRLRALEGDKSDESAVNRSTDIRSLRRQLRGDLDRITMKAVAKDRTQRYSTATELAADIRRHLADEPILATPPSLPYRLRKMVRRHRTAFVAVSAVLLVAVVFVGYVRYRSNAAAHDLAVEIDTALQSVAAHVAGGRLEEAKSDLGRARERFAILRKSSPEYGDPADWSERLQRFDRELRGRESRELRKVAEASGQEYLRLLDVVVQRQRELTEVDEGLPKWFPVWYRKAEREKLDALREAQDEAQDHYGRMVRSFQRALEIAPEASVELFEARTAFARAYRKIHGSVVQREPVRLGAEYFRRQIRDLDGDVLADRETLRLKSSPPGAEVYCFRYQPIERRLVPLPYGPSNGSPAGPGGVAGGPWLEIETIWDAELARPFEVGDRLIRVGRVRTTTHSELAASLESVQVDETVEIEIERSGTTLPVGWVPFPSKRYDGVAKKNNLIPGLLICPREQFGFTFAAYPLRFVGDGPVARTGAAGPVSLSLPAGSYLIVLRKSGYVDTRLPVVVPAPDRTEGIVDIRLVPLSDAPDGFVYIPAGPATVGGDEKAAQSLEFAFESVRGFFMSRYETTVGEYLEFLNDPIHPIHKEDRLNEELIDKLKEELQEEVDEELIDKLLEKLRQEVSGELIEELIDKLNEELDEDLSDELQRELRQELIEKVTGKAVPASSEVPALLEMYGDRDTETEEYLVDLIPRPGAKDPRVFFKYDHDENRWVRTGYMKREDWPMAGVSHFAALEYAHWYTVKKGRNRKFRLPSDVEWEKAARGVDARVYVWGNDLVRSYCWCLLSIHRAKRFLAPVGVCPFDESVFGVRDLAGSVSEHTTDITFDWRRFGYRNGRFEVIGVDPFFAFRGGNFDSPDDFWLRAATRAGRYPQNPGLKTGIRLVADLERE